jgi:hypothetical protein
MGPLVRLDSLHLAEAHVRVPLSLPASHRLPEAGQQLFVSHAGPHLADLAAGLPGVS